MGKNHSNEIKKSNNQPNWKSCLDKHLKERCSTSYVIREFQIKTMSSDYTSTRVATIHNTDNSKCCLGTLIHHWWECRMVQPLQRTVWRFLMKVNMVSSYDPAVALLYINPMSWEYVHTILTVSLMCLYPYVPHKNLHMNLYSSFIYNCKRIGNDQVVFKK